ncbi:MAG: exodeoxyribonuclease III [Candidatus Paceibacterota bacterium]|jgi:exodeoxyribonuclease-3
MKILSWNVNGLRAAIKKGSFDWLVSHDFDIFCLQETKVHPEQLESNIVHPVGYFSYFDHSKLRKGYSGVAIYTRIKPIHVEYGFGIPELDQEGRQIALFFNGFFETSSKVVLINTYFPNGGGGPERLAFKMRYYEAFLKYVDGLREKGYSVIFTGDVNTAHKAIDLARPKENEKNTGFLPEERAWIDTVIEHGYIDTFRHFNPDKKDAYSWWDMKTFARERNVGWRIDYFFASDDLKDKVKKADILFQIMGSDHCPVLLELSK